MGGDNQQNQEDYSEQWQVQRTQWQVQRTLEILQDLKAQSIENNKNLAEQLKTFATKDDLENKVTLIHAEYRPMKKNINRISVAIISFLALAAVQLLLNLYRSSGGS